MIFDNVLSELIYFFNLTTESNVLWSVLPLIIATIIIVVYFQRYRDENPGWNSYLTNSLVLLFVSMELFRHIYNIDGAGAINFLDYQARSIASVFLFLIGFLVLRFNFEHLLPERFSRYISSPITINLVAYAIILFVHSNRNPNFVTLISLLIMIIFFSLILNSIKIPAREIFDYVEKEKRKDKIKDIKEEKYQIDELKRELKQKERRLNKIELEKIEKERRDAIKMKKIIKK